MILGLVLSSLAYGGPDRATMREPLAWGLAPDVVVRPLEGSVSLAPAEGLRARCIGAFVDVYAPRDFEWVLSVRVMGFAPPEGIEVMVTASAPGDVVDGAFAVGRMDTPGASLRISSSGGSELVRGRGDLRDVRAEVCFIQSDVVRPGLYPMTVRYDVERV